MLDTRNHKNSERILEGKIAIVLHRSDCITEDIAFVRTHYAEGTYIFIPLEYSILDRVRSENLAALDLCNHHLEEDRSRYMPLIYRWVTGWYQDPSLREFAYGDTQLGSVYEWPLTLYIWRVLYYQNLFKHILTVYGTPTTFVLVGTDDFVSETAGPLASEEVLLIERVLRQTASSKNSTVTCVTTDSIGAHKVAVARTHAFLLFLLRHISIGAARFLRVRPIRIFMSEYWHNVSAFLPNLDKAEVVCMDRKEVRILLPFIRRLKIRFDRPSYFLRIADRVTIASVGEKYQSLWNNYQNSVSAKELCVMDGNSLYSLIEPALKKIVCVASVRYLEDRIGAQGLMKAYDINRVLVRASVSTQQHFLAIADAAKEIHIPCIELQHGLEYWGPNSLSTRKHASAIATYGELPLGIDSVTSIPIGSPRFDAYRASVNTTVQISLRTKIVVLVPEIGIENFTSFDVSAFLRTVVRVARADTKNSWIFKFRPGMLLLPEYAHLTNTLLRGFDLQEQEPLIEVLKDARVLIGHFSTAVLEAMLSRVPVVLWTGHSVDAAMLSWRFGVLKERGGITYAPDALALVRHTSASDELLEAQVAVANAWLSEEFRFDGKSSERMKDLLRTGW